MNEQIQNLADQAYQWALAESKAGENMCREGSAYFLALEKEKFAELLVRECCSIFVELRTRPADLAVLDVKKHFGVE